MTLWIPGGTGLLGSALKAKRQEALATGSEVDISQRKAVQEFLDAHPEIGQILNCAAESRVDFCETEKERAFSSNALGPEILAEEAKRRGLLFCHISTDYVFPGDLPRPLLETDPTGPCNSYGATKLEGEKRVERAYPEAWIVRTSWIFGEGGKNLIARLVHWMQEETEVRLNDEQKGRPTSALDLAEALLLLLERRPSPGIYHFANHGVTNRYAFGCFLKGELERLKVPLRVQKIVAQPSSAFPAACKRPLYSAFDTAKIEQALSFRPRPWKEALSAFLEEKFGGS